MPCPPTEKPAVPADDPVVLPLYAGLLGPPGDPRAWPGFDTLLAAINVPVTLREQFVRDLALEAAVYTLPAADWGNTEVVTPYTAELCIAHAESTGIVTAARAAAVREALSREATHAVA